ncbi:unnamed protein product [Paramecium pentaurelia]|uniref:Uncharacterized protein n=1 Tax=Paramecium pentaurelia TaxID=43138 RepID=A0A8S1SH09_9CILI|nr:unnamed protein product [Paramecium pentaurelia]
MYEVQIEQEQTVVIRETNKKREQLRHDLRRKALNEQFKKKRTPTKELDMLNLLKKLRSNESELCRVLKLMQDANLEENEEIAMFLHDLMQENLNQEIRLLCKQLINLKFCCIPQHLMKNRQQY